MQSLRYFVAVAEELSFSRAAGRLRMTQPPLSRCIRELEEDLGMVLFERSRRRVRLTSAGEVLRNSAVRIFGEIDRAVEDARRASRGEAGSVKLAYVPAADFNILPRILKGFRERHAHVRVDVHAMTTPEQLIALRSRHIDLGIVRLPAKSKDVILEPLTRESLVLAAPEGHPLARSSNVSLGALENAPFIVPRRDSAPILQHSIRRLLENAGVEVGIAAESENIHDALSLVAGGMGVSLFPESVRVIRRRGIVYRPIQPKRLYLETGLAYQSGDGSQARNALIRIARSLYGKSKRSG
jgi:DNA-binding transcriptional LysR family regulator